MRQINTPRYLPFIKHPALINIGASRIDSSEWIEPDSEFKRYYQNKYLQAEKNKSAVYLALEESLEAQAEFSALLLKHLTADHADSYSISKNSLDQESLNLSKQNLNWPLSTQSPFDMEKLWRASLWIQDDICLLQPCYTNNRISAYKLTAGSVCAPSHWRLKDKIGADFFALHSPVPGLQSKLQDRVMRLFDKLDSTPIVRANWGLSENDTLMRLPEDQQLKDSVAPDSDLFLRAERQSLRKLPNTGAIVFTIRVYTYPLESIRAIDGAATALKESVAAMSPEEYQYKSMRRLEPALNLFFQN